MRVWCGIDWAEQHHDVCLVDDHGAELARRRIGNDVTGFTILTGLLAEHAAASDAPVPVAIEAAKGLICAALRAAGYQLYPVNPLAVSATGTGTRHRGAKAIPATRTCWPTSCAPIPARTGRSPQTVS